MSNEQNTLDVEVIFGAMQREKTWKIAALFSFTIAVSAIGVAGYVITSFKPPAPVVVPYDVATGRAIQNAAVNAISLDEEAAIVEASVYRYVIDRETYNQLDNDLRIGRAIRMSDEAALAGIKRVWNSAGSDYPPAALGSATMDVEITNISRVSEDRMQVRLVKTLRSQDGVNQGSFNVVLKYQFVPNEEKTLEGVWENPLGFKVTEYSISADKQGIL